MFKICLFCLKLVDSFKVFVLFAQSYRTQWARSYLRMSVLISWQFCQQQHFTELSRGFIEWRQQKLHGFLRIFLSLKIHESTISSATLLQRNSLKYDERGMEVHILRLTHLEVTLLCSKLVYRGRGVKILQNLVYVVCVWPLRTHSIPVCFKLCCFFLISLC